MVTTRKHHFVVLTFAVVSLLAIGCSKKESSTSAAESTTSTASSEAPKSTGTSATGSARCTEEALGKGAAASRAGATVTDLSCNSLGSRAVATVKDGGECSGGCVGYFIAKGSDWSLEGTQPVSAEVDTAKFADWSTLHASWKAKHDAVASAGKPSGGSGGAVSTSISDEYTTTSTAPLLPPDASAYCQYYGPIPRCLQDPKYDPNTTTTPPPDPAATP